MANVPDEVVRHYASIDEGLRITRGFGQLELLRIQELVRRYLPSGRALRIADVGGAKGAHAQWLAEDGHSVHLIDPVAEHVMVARGLAPRRGEIFADVGQAGQLPFPDCSMDAVLLFGPLYHLTDPWDRASALEEAVRVVLPAGLVFVAAISRFASLIDGLARGFLFDSEFHAIVERDLTSGQHRNPTDKPAWFTTAYFHHPDELRDEAERAGLDVVGVFGVEGVAMWLPHLAVEWEDPARREAILFSARVVESEPSLLGASGHLLLVARRAE